MTFLLSSTFTDSLAKLTAEEQKVAKTTSFDLQVNPTSPGHNFHKLERARDKHFWSVRVSSDLRIIVHRTDQSLMLCYVDHHDKAYSWAERRKLEVHPSTGAAQLVEIRETVQEIIVPKYVDEPKKPKPLLFARFNDTELLSWGVPTEWLDDVHRANEDSLLVLADHLPAEAAETLLEVATGGIADVKHPVQEVDPFQHPDAQRRFHVMSSSDELQAALESPWEKWIVFLHPDQKGLVEGNYSGPFRTSGSSGTGKTIVALHRAVYLAKANPDARILLATFTDALAHSLKDKVNRLMSGQPKLAERLEVHSMLSFGVRLMTGLKDRVDLVSDEVLEAMLSRAVASVGDSQFPHSFLRSEWDDVFEAWNLGTWESYRDVARLGRKVRLPENQRKILWEIFTRVRTELDLQRQVTVSGMFNHLSLEIGGRKHPPFEFIVLDEAQDISLPQLRFLAAMGEGLPNRLFFAGDIAQRIFRTPFSWKAAGIDLRGRCKTLRVNYRTSHQIRRKADRLLGKEVGDVDGNMEDRSSTVSLFNGPEPLTKVCADRQAEIQVVVAWIQDLLTSGTQAHELAIIVRSDVEFPRAHEVVADLGLPFVILDEHASPAQGKISVVTMHLAKGLEFRAVVVMACDSNVIPLAERIDAVHDTAELEEVYNTERNLLYVACTRARDFLLITSGGKASEFLDDMVL